MYVHKTCFQRTFPEQSFVAPTTFAIDSEDNNKPVWPTRVVGILSGVRVVERYNRGHTRL